MDLNERSKAHRRELDNLRERFATVIVGNGDTLDFILKALFNGGHILIEGLPGMGKTLIVRTVSKLLNLEFSRIQFTPDLMPSDILGVNIIMEDEQGHRAFRFERGPVFANVLLADEINRATPKTQSALLQVMEERHVTIFGNDYALDDVFLVMATQNPIELKGTYPLPEAQLDRFMFKLTVPSPSRQELEAIVRLNLNSMGSPTLPEPVMERESILAVRDLVRRIPVESSYFEVASTFIHRTNPESADAPDAVRKYVRYGSSPRGLMALLGAARVSAFLDGRFNLAWDDLRENYLACLRHRLILNFEAQVQQVRVEEILTQLFESLDRPR